MTLRYIIGFGGIIALVGIALGWAGHTPGDEPGTGRTDKTTAANSQGPLLVGNVFPHMTVVAPGVGSTSETGIGALIPWADRLWAVGYVAHIRGSGIGLYEIGPDMSFRKHPASVTGTFANRLVHWESKQVFIGPHAIDSGGNVRTIEPLAKHRLTATARHLTDPKGKVYFLTMEGLLFETDVKSLETKQLADLVRELKIPTGAQPHFKGAHTSQGRLVVANNTYEEPEFLGKRAGGRLAEWDGTTWKVLEDNPFIEVSGKQNPVAGGRYGNTLFAVGWDRASVILRVLHDGQWTRYRLPKGGQSWDHTWNTEWMRIREVQTERYLMDAFGIFYELPPMVYGGRVWGIKPICNHLRICPDMCYWRGLFVLAGDQTDNAVGQPQSGLWFGSIDDLWRWGKPGGWGAVWMDQNVEAHAVSDPFLMTGFDKKVIHLRHTAKQEVTFTVQVDFLGTGQWVKYKDIRVDADGYAHHEFPDGFAAHWVRVVAGSACQATVSFHYQ
ncbi:MAG: hypothetical protein K1X57_16815 [Gemmataceae bacterium]|nr:hypothetical protein [Gemmataceae bacterium]